VSQVSRLEHRAGGEHPDEQRVPHHRESRIPGFRAPPRRERSTGRQSQAVAGFLDMYGSPLLEESAQPAPYGLEVKWAILVDQSTTSTSRRVPTVILSPVSQAPGLLHVRLAS
jgi:hypothetical protein